MILISVGANLASPNGSSPLQTCRTAVQSVAALPGMELVALSSWYESSPVPPSDQPLYINGLARFDGDMEPEALLESLHSIEAQAGRVRGAVNAPRPLDLDIIAMDDTVRVDGRPILPHPRAHERHFVLLPLAEVAPDWVHPVLKTSVAGLISLLPETPICRPLKGW